MKIAVYSGSFNPLHNGHLAVAQAALAEGCDEVWLIVTPQNPHKKEEDLWPFEDRMKMAETSVAKLKGIKASDCENSLPRPSYTLKTLEYLQYKYPENRFCLLIGEDNLATFHLWKEYKKILDLFGLIVYPRFGSREILLPGHPNIRKMKAPLLDISSSDIRKRLSENRPIRDMVPPEVEEYIRKKWKTDPPGSQF
jgi:nicotinate-nucleotide adenylyltransferase